MADKSQNTKHRQRSTELMADRSQYTKHRHGQLLWVQQSAVDPGGSGSFKVMIMNHAPTFQSQALGGWSLVPILIVERLR